MNPNKEDETRQRIAAVRRDIDAIDARILDQLNERLSLARRIGEYKAAAGHAIVDKAREDQMLRALAARNPGPLANDGLKRIFSEIIAASRQLQEPRVISYLGPEATFTHFAALEYFETYDRLVPQPSIKDVFDEVEKGASRYGVVPVENSIEGAVNHTLDLFQEADLKICGEIYLVISHDLLSRSGRMEDIRTIYSHPQTFAQCRRWLGKHLPEADLVECSSNAQAAKMALTADRAGAIAGGEAGRIYGLQVVASRIQDVARNTTRFLVIGNERVPVTGNDKTSLMFVTAHVPGALFKALGPIAEAGVNMIKLESRPAKYENWSYVFFVDLLGHAEEEPVKGTLARMKDSCQFLKVLGSYPVATMGG
ncbi:MAG: prephenate dehydratase [Thermodesulfobacteriota bacterium]